MTGAAACLLFGLGRRLARPQGRLMAVLQTLLAQGGIMAVNFVTGVLTARVLGVEGRGEFAAIALWLMIPSLLATAGLQTALVFETGRDASRRIAATGAALLLSTLLFIPLAAVCLPILTRLLRDYPAWVTTVAEWAMILSLVNVWVVIARGTLLGARDYTRFNLFTLSFAILYLVALVALACLHRLTPATAIVAQLASTAAMLALWAPGLAAGWRQTRRADLRAMVRTLPTYAVRAAPADIVTAVGGSLDSLVLVGLVDPREMGLYAAALSFARILSVVQTAISAVMLADLVGRPAAEIELFLHRGFRVLLWSLILCCGLLFLVDRNLLRLVYGAEFAAATPVFHVLLVDAALACLGTLVSQPFLALESPLYTSRAQSVSFAVSVVAIVVLAPVLGAFGAALARALGSAVRVLLLLMSLPRIRLRAPSLRFRGSDFAPVLRMLRAS